MNYALVRKERISKLENKISRITNALKTYPYTKPSDILEDVAALEASQKELEVQKAYTQLETGIALADRLLEKAVSELYS